MSDEREAPGTDGGHRFAELFRLGRRATDSTGTTEGPRPDARAVADVVRGRSALRFMELGHLYFDRFLGRALPEQLNPFLQTGAITLAALSVATATGVVLLLWYRPSVALAYESVAAMSLAPWTAGLIRSLHRYSSDAAIFFALAHASRLFIERRFAGARWIAWLAGVAALASVWFVGWTGYWLVWDSPAQHIAVGTARALDILPVFVDPMGRSFLVDASINSLLFFSVFFVHMLVPLGTGVLVWLHLTRISRPRFLTRTPMTLWVLGCLVLTAVIFPAPLAERAQMTALSQQFEMDWWYLLPVVLTDRLGGGALWAVLLGSSVALGGVPWWMVRRRGRPALVNEAQCNSCEQCFHDCPYDAISMVARTDDRPYPLTAWVNPSKCVACGICAGSCNPVAIDLDAFPVPRQRRMLEEWVKEKDASDDAPDIAIVCMRSAGSTVQIDPETGLCDELPGYRVLEVPCAGWLHPLTLERVLRRGAAQALVVSCGCRYREGEDWLRGRLGGYREPMLRTDKVDPNRIHLQIYDRTRGRQFVREALGLREGEIPPAVPPPSRAVSGVVSVALAALVAVLLGAVSNLGYAAPQIEGSQLVITFKHPGQLSENCRDLTPEEQARRPVHMRKEQICDRGRADVRLRVTLDGERVVDSAYPPSGIWSDGNSVAVEIIPVAEGEHHVAVEIGDSPASDEWGHRTEETLNFTQEARRVITFDRLAGFVSH